MKTIIGKKVGMTHIFDEAGNFVPVTVVEAGPCTVTQVKTAEKEGYDAFQIGFGKGKNIVKPLLGHLKKSKSESKILREVKIENVDDESTKVGDQIKVDIFSEGDLVNVTGISKGKGFAGTIKRHNFHRGPKTHGSHNYRAPGSIGAGYPEHVFKGQKLPGQMGHEQVTIKQLKVIKVDVENNILAIRGAIPGPRKSTVLIKG
ncbi:MAG: 50S ribosomal protein L3 [Patescibacteria group bacterium]|nr:50S ribosomal protein L3 [Patescibacteria group bacterium]